MLHRPYLPGGMVVEIAVDSITFYYIALDNLILLQGYLNDLVKSLQPDRRPTPSEEVTRVRLGVSIDPTP
jgi:hypothetical protein